MNERTIAHVAYDQSDLETRGTRRLLDEAIEVLRVAYREELQRKARDPRRLIRFKLMTEERE